MSDSPDPRATLSAEPSHAAANLTRKGTFKSPVRALITASEPTPLPPTGTTQRKSVKKKAPTLPSAKVPAASAMALYFARTPVFGRLPNRGFRAHTATVLGTELFLFGGCDKVCYRDVWKLDLDSGFWTKPPISPLAQEKLYPPPCRAHTMTRVGTRLVCFGGGDAGLYYNSTWVFVRCWRVRSCMPLWVGPEYAYLDLEQAASLWRSAFREKSTRGRSVQVSSVTTRSRI
jgi:hypothetical protein